jgi:uncharacterized OB-fold protein
VTSTEERPLRPRPSINRDNRFWFDALDEGRLLIQRCVGCGALRHPPGPVCPSCHSFDWDSVEATGRGEIYSYVINHHPQFGAFDYPLPVALIELEEGTRIMSNLTGFDLDAIEVGQPVQVEFVEYDDDLILPAFRPAAQESR